MAIAFQITPAETRKKHRLWVLTVAEYSPGIRSGACRPKIADRRYLSYPSSPIRGNEWRELDNHQELCN